MTDSLHYRSSGTNVLKRPKLSSIYLGIEGRWAARQGDSESIAFDDSRGNLGVCPTARVQLISQRSLAAAYLANPRKNSGIITSALVKIIDKG
jgi:hypothetical protein